MHDDVGRSSLEKGEQVPAFSGSQTATDRSAPEALPVELTAAVLALKDGDPVVLTRQERTGETSPAAALPSETYQPRLHAALEDAIRERVVTQTGLELGYIEQLATHYRVGSDRASRSGQARLSIGYLALIRVEGEAADGTSSWASCYDFLPWEDWRQGRPEVLSAILLPALAAWAAEEIVGGDVAASMSRRDRLRMTFAAEGGKWDDERVVERLDILDEAGLTSLAGSRPMRAEHRRILATALARLRAKVRSRPLVFELLPPVFTLFELQKTVEAILGPHLHKQNFRRLVEGTGLVEPTGEVRNHTGGRPAKLFRFRREVMMERPAPGVRIRQGRAA